MSMLQFGAKLKETAPSDDQDAFVVSDSAWKEAQDPNYLMLRDDSHKFMFCMLPKNACTEFLSLVMRISGLGEEHWNPTSAGEDQGMVHFDSAREPLWLFPALPGAEQRNEFQNILRSDGDDGWIKAVFLRDPVERLVSAFKSKVQTGYYKDEYPKDLELEDFVGLLEKNGLDESTDPHLRPQSLLCGLGETVGQYDFVGHFDNLDLDAHRMVNMIAGDNTGFAAEMLDNGWGPYKNQSLFGVSREVREDGGSYMPVTGSSLALPVKAGSILQAVDGVSSVAYAGQRHAGFSWYHRAAEASLFWNGTGAEYDSQFASLLQGVIGDEALSGRIIKLYQQDYDMLKNSAEGSR